MRKLCATITVVGATVLSSLVQAEGITGIYSCSSGVNNDRPVTYIFNFDLMLRNNAKEAPFEFLSSLNNGMLLYVGKQKSRNFDRYAKKHGLNKEWLFKWAYNRITWIEGGHPPKEANNPHRFFFETKIVTVDLNSAQIYEANIDQPETTKEYNCTVLDIDVPKIDPPEDAIKAAT